jgi:hypothetical protein
MRRWFLLLWCCQGCFWPGTRPPAEGVQAAVEALAGQVAPPGREVAVLGLRDGSGKRTPLTRLLDQELASALVRIGAELRLVEGEENWSPQEGVPARYWREVEAPVLLVGQVQQDSVWTYLRLQALDRARGGVLAAQTLRLESRALSQRLQAGLPAAEEELSIQLNLLVLREEGGFDRQVALGERGRLQVGDRLQLRFRSGTDCQVYAWLYSSAGQQQDLFSSQQVYKGRLLETTWITLDQVNQVHTLYLIAAPHLDEDKTELFDNLAELIRQGQIREFTGVERLDQALGAYLARYAPGQAEVQVQRQQGALGEEEKFILADGTVLKSRPLLLKATGVLAQALSFEVQ